MAKMEKQKFLMTDVTCRQLCSSFVFVNGRLLFFFISWDKKWWSSVSYVRESDKGNTEVAFLNI